MNTVIWFFVSGIFFIILVPKAYLDDIVDPFDMREYDSKTKTMKRPTNVGNTFGDSVDPFDMREYDAKKKTMKESTTSGENSLIDSRKCSDCSSYMQNFCELSTICNEVERKFKILKDSQRGAHLTIFLMRFVNMLLKKSRIKESNVGPDIQESILSIKLSRRQLRILNDFGESGNTALLQDVDEILSTQIDSYNPPLCAEDVMQKIYDAKEFFSESTFIILGILVTALVFFYNVFVLNKIRVALLSLIATIFFSGYFWTYWKMYEELMADLVRQANHGDIRDCSPTTDYFLWFFSYTVPADIKKCKEYYNARHTRPLSKLTPTLVFYETLKTFWGGFLQEIGEIVVTLCKELMVHSPWYIKWTVLPLVFIFVLVTLIVCVAFLAGKRFKLSHPIFGAIELDTDVNYYEQSKVVKDEIAYKVVRSSTGPDSSLNCLTCGTTFVQAAAISAQQVVITRTVAEKAENTDPENMVPSTSNSTQQNRLRSRFIRTGLNFIRKAVVSPLQQIVGSGTTASTRGKSVTDGGPPPPAEFLDPNESDNDYDGDSVEDHAEEQVEDHAEDRIEEYELITLEDDSDEDKENVVSYSAQSYRVKPSAIEIRHTKCFPSAEERSSCLAKFSSKSSPALLSPCSSQNLGTKKKYFDEIKFARSPDPKEERLIPIILSKPGTSGGACGEFIGTDRVDCVFRENVLKSGEKYFAKSNEKIKKQLSFKQFSGKLYTRDGSQVVRKLSL